MHCYGTEYTRQIFRYFYQKNDNIIIMRLSWTLSVPNFRRQCHLLFYFNKLSLGKTFIRKVDRLNVKPDETVLRCLQKPIIVACGSERVKLLPLSSFSTDHSKAVSQFEFFVFVSVVSYVPFALSLFFSASLLILVRLDGCASCL